MSTKRCDICAPNLTKRKQNFPEQTPDLSTIWSHLKIPEIRMSEFNAIGICFFVRLLTNMAISRGPRSVSPSGGEIRREMRQGGVFRLPRQEDFENTSEGGEMRRKEEHLRINLGHGVAAELLFELTGSGGAFFKLRRNRLTRNWIFYCG